MASNYSVSITSHRKQFYFDKNSTENRKSKNLTFAKNVSIIKSK